MQNYKGAVKIILVLFLVFFIAACGQTQEQSSAVEASDSASVEINNFQFIPDTVTIKRGGTVTWLQKDSVAHTVAIKDIEPSPVLNNGDTWSYSFDKTGNYNYICSIHPAMKGKIIVK